MAWRGDQVIGTEYADGLGLELLAVPVSALLRGVGQGQQFQAWVGAWRLGFMPDTRCPGFR